MQQYMWLVALMGSLGAVGAALAAWRSAKETQKTVLGQIVMQITDAYASDEMLSGKINLRNWQRQHGSDFAKRFGEIRRTDYSKIEQTDKARRRYSHHFHKIRLLLDTGVISEDFLKKMVTLDHIEFLLEVVEPLEKEIQYFNPSTFDTFRRIYRKENIRSGRH